MLQIINKTTLLLILILSSVTTEWADAQLAENKNSQLTHLDLKTVESLMSEITSYTEIPFDYPEGCHAKAQKISILLEQKNVITGKAFIEGQLFNQSRWGLSFWLFHVASYVLVDKDQKTEIYILDPFLSKTILTYDEWLALLKKDSRTQIHKQYFTNRFVYDPNDVFNNPVEYNPLYIADMELVFKQIRKRISINNH